ncbi:50S ribosomal protein L29 [Candidatus Peregrinibacteria bacterium]|nr:50S ribosomal protein L29 [Candidatus Peregrinibacteria bacterium]
MLTIQELRSSGVKELMQELKSARNEVLKARLGARTKHLKDTSLVAKHKRYIARVLTLLQEAKAEESLKTSKKQ